MEYPNARRAIAGVTYNTRTSTIIARLKINSDGELRATYQVCLTRNGNYFLSGCTIARQYLPKKREWKVKPALHVTPLNRESAIKWVEINKAELILEPVTAFAKAAIVERADSEVTACDLHAAFSRWAEAKGHNALTPTALGRKLTDLNFKRSKRGGVVRYVGVEIALVARLN